MAKQVRCTEQFRPSINDGETYVLCETLRSEAFRSAQSKSCTLALDCLHVVAIGRRTLARAHWSISNRLQTFEELARDLICRHCWQEFEKATPTIWTSNTNIIAAHTLVFALCSAWPKLKKARALRRCPQRHSALEHSSKVGISTYIHHNTYT